MCTPISILLKNLSFILNDTGSHCKPSSKGITHRRILEKKKHKDDSACYIKNTVGGARAEARARQARSSHGLDKGVVGKVRRSWTGKQSPQGLLKGLCQDRKKKRNQSFGLKN